MVYVYGPLSDTRRVVCSQHFAAIFRWFSTGTRPRGRLAKCCCFYPGLHAALAAPAGARALAQRVQADWPRRQPFRALVHRHRDPSRRDRSAPGSSSTTAWAR